LERVMPWLLAAASKSFFSLAFIRSSIRSSIDLDASGLGFGFVFFGIRTAYGVCPDDAR
jgi:hypothetical protein